MGVIDPPSPRLQDGSAGPVTLPTSLNKKREKKVLMGMHILKYDTYFWYFLSDFYPILLCEVVDDLSLNEFKAQHLNF